MPGVGPLADGGRQGFAAAHGPLVDDEGRAGEEGGYGHSEQEGAQHAVEHEQAAVDVAPHHVAGFRLELVADGLEDERGEDEHPYPVGAAETGAVEQGKGGEESAAERDERGERELPLAPGRVDDEATLRFVAPKAENERVGTLHEEQEDEQTAQQGDEKPPVVL